MEAISSPIESNVRVHRPNAIREFRRALPLYAFLMPSLVLLLVFQYYPAIMALYRSLFEWDIGAEPKWVGLENFVTMFTVDHTFQQSLWVVTQFTVFGIATVLTVPIIVAEAIYRLRDKVSSYWYRILMILPAVIPGIVHILIWQFLYEPRVGLVNNLLRFVGLESWTRAWLGDPDVVVYAAMFSHFPFVGGVTVLIYLAGLQTIPQEVHDASLVDGATGLRQIWSIDIPYIIGQIKLNIILGIIGQLQGFGYIFVLTQGGPANASMVPGLWLYTNAFLFSKVGYASAIGVFLFVIIMILTIINFKFIKTATY